MDLEKLSDDELRTLYRETSDKIAQSDIYQYAMKILINSLYGALGTSSFRYYQKDMAEAITMTGQTMIQFIIKRVNDYISKAMKEIKDYVPASDTDSVIGSSVLITSNGKMTIEDLYNLIDTNPDVSVHGNEFKPVTNLKSLTYTLENGLEYKPIKYIMRHKVSKKLYQITVSNGDNVVVTEDHSIKVIRNNQLIDVTPKELLNGDKIVNVKQKETQNVK